MSEYSDKNSSKTRVNPAFTIIKKNPIPFFKLLQQKCHIPLIPETEKIKEIRFAGNSQKEPTEKALPPTASYLKWLARNITKEILLESAPNSATPERKKLINPQTRKTQIALAEEEIDALDLSKPTPNEWFVLEGCSKPDVYIRTNSFHLVIEGKRTEGKPEVGTTWDPHRHQIIRHIEDLIQLSEFADKRNPLPCYGIFIIEDSMLKSYGHLNEYDSERPYRDSLKHLLAHDSDLQKYNTIRKAYKGFLTWQDIWEAYKNEKNPIKYIKSIEYYRPEEFPPRDHLLGKD